MYKTARNWCVNFIQSLRTPAGPLEIATVRQRLNKTGDNWFWTGYERINETHYQNEKGILHQPDKSDPVHVVFSNYHFSIKTADDKPGQ